jgi:hypothetical protein
MEPTDEVLQGRMSNPAGCNASEPTGSLVTLSYGGRASEVWAKAASFNVGVASKYEGRSVSEQAHEASSV